MMYAIKELTEVIACDINGKVIGLGKDYDICTQ